MPDYEKIEELHPALMTDVINQNPFTRVEGGKVIIDPVLPFSLDGLTASMNFMDRRLLLRYQVKQNNFGPRTIHINGRELEMTHEENPYRPGGAVISAATFSAMLDRPENRIDIYL